MLATKEFFLGIDKVTDFALFVDGKLQEVIRVDPTTGGEPIVMLQFCAEGFLSIREFFRGGRRFDVFPVGDVIMPKNDAIYDAIEKTAGSKVKTCMQWFHGLEEGELKRRCLGDMIGDIAQETKAHTLSEAIQVGVDKTGDSVFWINVLTDLKKMDL